MKAFHVPLRAKDIFPNAIGFYSALFAAEPPLGKPDYAKWRLDDPRVKLRRFRRAAGSRGSIISASRSRARTNCRDI